MKKRHFLLMGLGAMGALTIGWGLLPPRQRLMGATLPLDGQQISLNAWLVLNPDGTVTLAMPKSEMGQGVHTALAMLVAEELDVPLSSVRVVQSPIDRLYGNVAAVASGLPFRDDDAGVLARTARWTMLKVARELGMMMTGGSSSVKDLWLPLREAAAMTRASLIAAVAQHWDTATGTVMLASGLFTHSARTSTPSAARRMTLGEVVTQLGTKIKPASEFKLKDLADFKLLGQPTLRTDSQSKVNGSAAFGIDAALKANKRPHLYAAVLMSPVRGGAAASVDSKAALTMAGVTQIVTLPANIQGSSTSGGVAVVAASYWQAKKALDALKVNWLTDVKQSTANASNESIQKVLANALATRDGFTYYKQGDVTKAMPSAASKLTATFSAPYLAHATMEPMNATVELLGKGRDRQATLWIGTQVPDFVQSMAAQVLRVAKDKVKVVVPYLGGGFGRRLEADIAAQVCLIAKIMHDLKIENLDANSENRTCLQMIWSREVDMQHDFYRPAAIAKFEAGLDKDGNISAWVNKAASQHITPQFMTRNAGLPMGGPDKTSIEGAFDQAYEFPHAHVAHVAVDLPVPVGYWRSVGHSHQAFFQESFLDECAHTAQIDPIQYRRQLLKQHPRQLAALNLAVSKHGSESPQTKLGVALHESFGSIVAMVAEVSVSKENDIRVHKITVAIDCGFCVNPAGVSQQVESSVAYGLSAALWGKVDWKYGAVQQSNFHDYRVLRMNEMPVVATHIVPSTLPPEGVGEPALPPVAPAVANAVFALTGQRLRQLPLSLEKIAT